MSERKLCLGCGGMFDVSGMSLFEKEKRNYCVPKCYYQRNKFFIKKDTKCQHCDKVFIKKGHMPPPNFKSRRFCGKSCAASFQWDRHRDDFEELFWSKVEKKGIDECWPWKGNSLARNGYGRIKHKGKMLNSHRVAYRLAKKNIADGMYILHSCDNPPCCNPEHLSEGTHLQNMADMTAKGRRHGLHRDINPSSKVSAALKKDIIKDYDALPRGRRYVERGSLSGLAKKYNISCHLINDLVRHRHV